MQILPEVFRTAAQTNAPLQALSAVAEDFHAPVHRVLDALPSYFDPYQTPEAMLPFLSRWVDLDWLSMRSNHDDDSGASVVPDRLRDLLANAAELSAQRGTAQGLCRFLHLATGVPGFTIEDVAGDFHVNVGVPASAAGQLSLVNRIVATMKPAHTTCRIELRAAQDGAEDTVDPPLKKQTVPEHPAHPPTAKNSAGAGGS